MVLAHKINLSKDWESLIKNKLIEQGHVVPPYEDKLQLGIYFCNLEYMRIPSVRRKIYISNEFKCPPQYKKRVEKLKKMIERGENINPYLSTGTSRIRNRDYLLYDWNIYHIHLGKHDSDKKFSRRTKELLFAYITKSEAYFLNVFDHDNFANKDLLHVIHKNWPEVIKPFLLHSSIKMEDTLPSEATHLFRKNGISSFTKLDSGEIYYPPGRGIVSTSDSARAVDSTLKLLNILHKVEREIVNNPKEFLLKIYENTGIKLNYFHIELKINRGIFFLKETNTEYTEYLFDHQDYLNLNNA
ncbi:hypothetical protein [Planococcus rifietoensis]|uniref:hypothetical protein n=1 Tax=Planococcus rifietoensis TaxID=200991 RepID=UPI00385004BD